MTRAIGARISPCYLAPGRFGLDRQVCPGFVMPSDVRLNGVAFTPIHHGVFAIVTVAPWKRCDRELRLSIPTAARPPSPLGRRR